LASVFDQKMVFSDDFPTTKKFREEGKKIFSRGDCLFVPLVLRRRYFEPFSSDRDVAVWLQPGIRGLEGHVAQGVSVQHL